VNIDTYDERFNQYQVEELRMLGITPDRANRYDAGFDGDGVVWLLKVGCPNDTAVQYDKRFSGKAIFKLFQEGIDYEIANRYDARFSTTDIINLHGAGILPAFANSASSNRFFTDNIIELFKKGCPLELAEQYHPRFSSWDIGYMYQAGCLPGNARKYNSQFNGLSVAQFFKNNISPEKVDRFNKNNAIFNAADIMELEKAGCSPDTSNEYKNFYRREIIQLFNMGCLPAKANMFRGRFSGKEIVRLCQLDCTFDRAAAYNPERFSGEQIIRLLNANCPAETASNYNGRFSGEEVAHLAEAKIDPETAGKYDPVLKGTQIVVFSLLGFTPEKLRDLGEHKRATLYAISSSIVRDVVQVGEPISFEFDMVGDGATAIILRKDNKAFKYSTPGDLDIEFRNFKELGDRNCQHIVKLLGVKKDEGTPLHKSITAIIRDEMLDKLALELEYIPGNTLRKILEKKVKLAPQKVLKYGFGILRGIEVLRQASLFHRDLHDGNIMIDENRDQPVIIDLGTVVTRKQRFDVHNLNRAFGGNNDLLSLAQLMYKMASGSYLFLDENTRFNSLDEMKNRIETVRKEVYLKKKSIEQYFEKVRRNVEGEVGELIVSLLNDDLWLQPPDELFADRKSRFIRVRKNMLSRLINVECQKFGNKMNLKFYSLDEKTIAMVKGRLVWGFSLADGVES
jgi:tRNA A-37 threonylcarbamoyl transferase component Bud32